MYGVSNFTAIINPPDGRYTRPGQGRAESSGKKWRARSGHHDQRDPVL